MSLKKEEKKKIGTVGLEAQLSINSSNNYKCNALIRIFFAQILNVYKLHYTICLTNMCKHISVNKYVNELYNIYEIYEKCF